jgi:uncharacterized protein YceH (UPF0502 family)
VNLDLTPDEARVLGCLMEKSVITPENYPLSLNALVNACNQKSSRDPVLSLDPGVVQRTINELVAKSLVTAPNLGGRVDKYQQCFCNTHFATTKLSPAEFAIVSLLLLRGPQTPGELKAHSGRLHEFADPGEVDAALDALMARADGPLVARLPREPRRKDHTYAHLLSGSIASVPADSDRSEVPAPRVSALAELEARVAKIEESLASLKQALGVE